MIRSIILAAIVGALIGAYEGRRKTSRVPDHLLN